MEAEQRKTPLATVLFLILLSLLVFHWKNPSWEITVPSQCSKLCLVINANIVLMILSGILVIYADDRVQMEGRRFWIVFGVLAVSALILDAYFLKSQTVFPAFFFMLAAWCYLLLVYREHIKTREMRE